MCIRDRYYEEIEYWLEHFSTIHPIEYTLSLIHIYGITGKEKVSIAFMKEMADDLTRKRSAFWNCQVDAFLCPVCAFVYPLIPICFHSNS